MHPKSEQAMPEQKQMAGEDNSGYTLGPIQEGPVCCDPQPLIQVDNFSLRYGDKAALDHVTLDIYRGCITALIGPSGCGKTSFLSSVNRLTDLIPGCRITGRIRIDGRDIHDPACDVPTSSADRHGVPEADSVSTLDLPQHRVAFTRTWHNASCRHRGHHRTSVARCGVMERSA